MFKIRDISIRNKLVLMQVFTSVVVLSVFFVVFILSDIESYKARKEASITSLAHVIAANSISAIQFRDDETATEMLTDLRNIAPEISHAVIIDKDGKNFASYAKAGFDSSGLYNLQQVKKTGFSGNHLFVIDNIIDQKKLIGKVALQVELSELEQIKKERYGLVSLLLAGSIAFSFLVAFILQAYISRRLLHLVNKMKEAGKTGNYVTVKDEGKDEISSLIQAFNMLMVEVKDSQHKKDEFIGIASHELKTPLTTIKGYLDLLNTIETDQTNRQFVKKSLDGVHKLERLIGDLLDVSRIQSGQLQLNLKEFYVEDLLNETIDFLQMMLSTHKITRQFQLNGEVLFADKQRIEQVLINLLSNAVKYSPGGEEIVVSSKRVDSNIIIQIRDYGLGVEASEMPQIFERFYRTKSSAENISGFGLGLYICRDIIQRHNGEIWVEREQKGSSFFISLPLQKDAGPSKLLNETIINNDTQ